MKNIIIFIISINLFANNISEQYLQGTWIKISWDKQIRDLLKFEDLNEKRFESIQFAGEYYLYHSSDKEHTYNKDRLINKLYSFKLITDKNNIQWVGFKNGTQMIGIDDPARWMYWGISKITQELVTQKENREFVDLQLGDIVLTLYNQKTKKIIYRKQFRKMSEK